MLLKRDRRYFYTVTLYRCVGPPRPWALSLDVPVTQGSVKKYRRSRFNSEATCGRV